MPEPHVWMQTEASAFDSRRGYIRMIQIKNHVRIEFFICTQVLTTVRTIVTVLNKENEIESHPCLRVKFIPSVKHRGINFLLFE